MKNHWYVIDSKCFPKRWKVTNDYYRVDNDASNFYEKKEVAEHEASRRNETEKMAQIIAQEP